MINSSILVGANGSLLIADTSADLNLAVSMIIVQQDATSFTALEETGDVDVLIDRGLSGASLKKGAIITPLNKHFTKIQLSTGSIMAY